MDYKPRPENVRFLLNAALDAPTRLAALAPFAEVDEALQSQVLEEAGRFVGEVIAPLNRTGDETGCRFAGGEVTSPPGFREAYQAFVDGGWPALSAATEDGGQGLPAVLEAVLYEWLAAANHGFTMAPGLLHGAYACLKHHGSDELKQRYLPKIATGEWLATMCLTEAHAGSDLGQVRTRAVPQADGSLRVSGGKIFISGGEHDLTPNIVHLVLCRLPDAPAGPKGLSLALVPKLLPDGTRNAVHCERIEEKMGLHGSPTCTMRFDDATGWLVGEPGRGLAAMFVMMNSARLHVALQGIGLLDAAWQKADAYAAERRQMRAPGPVPASRGNESADLIAEHPAVRRILDTQRAWIDGARTLAYRSALMLDVAAHDADPKARERAQRWCSFVTPVLKAACTQQAFQGASECLQVFGGHGYVREWGIEQIVRDSRVTMIYEGTNEIQAIDLLVRKVLPDGGAGMSAVLLEMRDTLDASREADADVQRRLAQLRYLGTTVAMAAHANPALPCEVADDYLRVAMLTMLAWAWARIEAAAPQDSARARVAAAFRRWVLPEFEMRLGIVKRACETVALTTRRSRRLSRARLPGSIHAVRSGHAFLFEIRSRESEPSIAPPGKADRLDARMLETLVGYNARRAWLIVSDFFAERMAPYGLKQIDFSVLSLLAHNPGATSRQLCSTLDILPPNLVSLVATLDSRGLIERRPHPHDGRAVGLYLTPAGDALIREAEQAVMQLEADASARLTARERETLIRLLQKIYL